jgi:hypothetical protein
MTQVVRVRIPKVVYCASKNGWHLQKIYYACESYAHSYFHCLILIKTMDDEVFGAYIDTVPFIVNNECQGTQASFIFNLIPEVRKFQAIDDEYIATFEKTFIAIGTRNATPALRLDESLKFGRSEGSETFGTRKPLMGKLKEGAMKNDFEL